MMKLDEMVEKAKTEFTQMASSKVDGVTGFSQSDGCWVVSLEVLERRAIPDSMDVLGVYEVRLDEEGHLLSFERKRLRKRGDITGG
jgi:hypothetical protein